MAKKKTQKKVRPKKIEKKHKISEGLAILSLILNILIMPGLGTLIGGKIREGIWQLVLLFGGILVGIILTAIFASTLKLLLVISIPITILGPVIAWIWGIVSGVQLIKESQK